MSDETLHMKAVGSTVLIRERSGAHRPAAAPAAPSGDAQSPPRRPKLTPAQRRLREEINAWNNATPQGREAVFWNSVQEAEGVLFMGGDSAFDESQRERMRRQARRGGRRLIVKPMSERAAWRETYLAQRSMRPIRIPTRRAAE